MKKIFALALICAAVAVFAAEKNLAPTQWGIYGKNNANQNTVIRKDGQIDCQVKNAKGGMAGVSWGLNFKTPVKGTLTFGAESKAEKVTGSTPHNYCVYLDLTYTDGKRLYGQVANFNGGTHDWEKKSTTIKLAKPVKQISFYVLFRNVAGKASFRNVFLYNK